MLNTKQKLQREKQKLRSKKQTKIKINQTLQENLADQKKTDDADAKKKAKIEKETKLLHFERVQRDLYSSCFPIFSELGSRVTLTRA